MKRVLIPAAAALVLTACGHRDNLKPQAAKLLAPALAAPTLVLTTPTPQNGLDWTASLQGDQGRLAYGPSAADGARLVLTCAKGSGKVAISRPVAADQAGTPPLLVLASGSARGRFLATAQPGAGSVELTATTTTTDPAIAAFERNGWIAVVFPDGKSEGMAPQPGDKAVRRFFDFCG